MESQTNVPLTASEMANLWASYNSESVSSCVVQYFIANNGDTDIRPILEYTLGICKQHLQFVTEIFTKEHFPIPVAFNENDVNLQAPRLYSDAFYLDYLKNMGKVGLATYGLALATSSRADIRSFYQKCAQEAAQLYQMTTEVLLSKGLFVRPPTITTPDKVKFITKKSFYGGLIGEQRPLTSVEITHSYHNIETNVTGHTLLLGFSQVAHKKEVRQHMIKGKDMAKHHIDKLRGLLVNDDIPSPMGWSENVTDSTVAPFSDKLMMFITTLMTAAGTGNYGLAIAGSPRKDVAATYIRLFTEAGNYAKDASDLMIENGWLEEPPQADDRKALSRT